MIKAQTGFVESGRSVARPPITTWMMRAIESALKKRSRFGSHNLSQLIEATLDFIITIDLKGRIIYCNPATRKILGIADDEDTATLCVTDIYTTGTRATVLGEGIFIAIQDGTWRGNATLLTRAGREVPVSLVIIALAEANHPCEFLALVARDVEEIRQVTESLRESEQFYHRVAQSADVGIWVIDRENQTVFVNPKMASMLGYTESEMFGKPATNFVRRQAIELSQLVIDDRHDLSLSRKDGMELCVSLSTSALYNEREQYMGTLALVTETTTARQWRDRIATS